MKKPTSKKPPRYRVELRLLTCIMREGNLKRADVLARMTDFLYYFAKMENYQDEIAEKYLTQLDSFGVSYGNVKLYGTGKNPASMLIHREP